MLRRSRVVSFVNGRVLASEGVAPSVRFADRVLDIGEAPQPGDVVVDLDGAFVLPGLVNAHEHLELNHYGRLKCRHRYGNATEWIDDLRPALREDARIRENSRYPLRDRLFIGGLKNLLAGATTVAHHNPLYRELSGRFPVRLVRRFGWAHSFALEGQPVGAHGELGGSVWQARAATPDDAPFVVHAGEGVDADAVDEITRLEAVGCLRQGTALVHGVALTEQMWKRLLAADASLIWCPESNRFLFGRTIPARAFLDACPEASSHLCLGTDSRITGSADLLDELRSACAADVTPDELLRMVTSAAARVLRLADAGRIALGAPADLMVIPPGNDRAAAALLRTRRRDVLCVTINGRPMIAARPFERLFAARRTNPRSVAVDGRERLADAALAAEIARCRIQEPGVVSFA